MGITRHWLKYSHNSAKELATLILLLKRKGTYNK